MMHGTQRGGSGLHRHRSTAPLPLPVVWIVLVATALLCVGIWRIPRRLSGPAAAVTPHHSGGSGGDAQGSSPGWDQQHQEKLRERLSRMRQRAGEAAGDDGREVVDSALRAVENEPRGVATTEDDAAKPQGGSSVDEGAAGGSGSGSGAAPGGGDHGGSSAANLRSGAAAEDAGAGGAQSDQQPAAANSDGGDGTKGSATSGDAPPAGDDGTGGGTPQPQDDQQAVADVGDNGGGRRMAAESVDSDAAGGGGDEQPQQPALADDNSGGNDDESTAAATKRPVVPPPTAPLSHESMALALVTTLKPCDRDAIFDAQLAAVATWSALPLTPPPVVYLIDAEATLRSDNSGSVPPTCSQLIAELVPRVKAFTAESAVSDHGTVLLGAALRLVAELEPTVDAIGLINGDILLDPTSAQALATAKLTFEDYFLIGRRASVDLRVDSIRTEVMPKVVEARQGIGSVTIAPPTEPAPPVDDDAQPEEEAPTGPPERELDPFETSKWFKHRVFAKATGDRIDAEDFFIFSRNFFDSLGYPIPDFHIGRPAFDNWFVHTAIHTLQPVVDATGAIKAYHQAHDYKHLKGDSDGGGQSPPKKKKAESGAADKKSWSYWGSHDQKANYDLAIAHGGWRHGLFDFAPLRYVCPALGGGGKKTSAKTPRHKDSNGQGEADPFVLEAVDGMEPRDCHGGVMTDDCLAVTLKSGWKPLGNDGGSSARDDVTLADMSAYFRVLTDKVKALRRKRWRGLAGHAQNPYFRGIGK